MEEICPDVSAMVKDQRDRLNLLRRMQRAAAGGGRKRIFLGLLSVSCFFVCLLLLLFLVAPWLGSGAKLLGPVSMSAGIIGISMLVWVCLTLIYHIYTGRLLPGISGARHLCIRFFLPLMEMAGRLAGADRNMVRRSFIKVNNEFVCANAASISPGELLVLLPHCIQVHHCSRRLVCDLSNCAGCGQCQIGRIRALSAEKGFRAAVATGGTIARRIVAEMHPKQIIAVACERDLTSGIQDSYPLPVFGILNERPYGPCRDTAVAMAVLESAVEFFLEFPDSARH